jgi:hypothetical protein
MGFGRGSRSAGSRERKDIPPSCVRESCVVGGANNEDEYTFRNAAIDDGEPPLWVKLRHHGTPPSGRLCPRERTRQRICGVSQMGQLRTCRPYPWTGSAEASKSLTISNYVVEEVSGEPASSAKFSPSAAGNQR